MVEGETEGSNLERYSNFSRTGSRGFEVDLRLRRPWGSLAASYSFYHSAGKNDVDLYAVASDPDALVGLSHHKVAARGHLRVWRRLSLNPSLTYLGRRHAYTGADEDDVAQLGEVEPVWLVDALLRYEDLVTEGLALDVGVHDLLDSGTVFVQPYAGDHAPLPGPSREYMVRLTYALRY